MTTLVRAQGREGEGLDALHVRIAELERRLEERTAAIARVESSLEVFRRRYQTEVGCLHDQLDELEYAIAEAELGELSARIADAGRPEQSAPMSGPAPLPRYTSDAVRKLFRDVAKAIHPDLARDESDRDRCHVLMAEANRAYRRGDQARLRSILQRWQMRPEAVEGDDPEATRERLLRRGVEIEEELARIDTRLAAVQDTPLWQLKVMVDEGARRGRDIVRDMVDRLKRDIMAATNRLGAMRPPASPEPPIRRDS